MVGFSSISLASKPCYSRKRVLGFCSWKCYNDLQFTDNFLWSCVRERRWRASPGHSSTLCHSGPVKEQMACVNWVLCRRFNKGTLWKVWAGVGNTTRWVLQKDLAMMESCSRSEWRGKKSVWQELCLSVGGTQSTCHVLAGRQWGNEMSASLFPCPPPPTSDWCRPLAESIKKPKDLGKEARLQKHGRWVWGGKWQMLPTCQPEQRCRRSVQGGKPGLGDKEEKIATVIKFKLKAGMF